MTKRELSLGLGIPLSLDFKDSPSDAMTLITVSDGESEKSLLISRRGMLNVDADGYLRAPKERLRPKNQGRREILAAGAQGAGWFFATVLLSFVALTLSGIISAKVILTGSMEPTLSPGDVVIAVSPDRKNPEVGDIVTYVGKRIDGSTVGTFTHRVIGFDEKDNLIMQGDANPTPDTQRPTRDDLVGVAIFSIPMIGSLLSPRWLMMLLLAGFGLWLIVDAFRNDD